MLTEKELEFIRFEATDMWERIGFLLIKFDQEKITRKETLDYINDIVSELVEQTT